MTGKVFDDVLRNVYSPETNTTGVINMGIANNSLMEKELLEVRRGSIAALLDPCAELFPPPRRPYQYFSHLPLDPTDLTYGTSLFGSTRLFGALSHHFNRPTFSPVTPVLEEHILTGPGCGPLLDQLFEHLAEPGQAALVAAPYYNGFDADLMTRAGVKCIPVYSPYGDGSEAESFDGETALRGFEEALAAAPAGSVSSLILCNPHNPLGRCYTRSALLAYGRFAQQHNLHLVVDEIYARSTFATSDDPHPVPFTSALSIDWQREASGCHSSRVHILTSASKDFGLNGFRLGVFISQHNPQLVAAMKSTSKLYMVSSPADALWSRLLRDETFYAWFVEENQQRLSAAYEVAKEWCMKHGIPYTHSNAGHFLVANLDRFMPITRPEGCTAEESQVALQEAEALLWSRVLQHGVCVTPGSNYRHPTPGIFRITFAMPEQTLREGLRRIELALGLGEGSSGVEQGVVAVAADVAAAVVSTCSAAAASQAQAGQRVPSACHGIYMALCGGQQKDKSLVSGDGTARLGQAC